MIIFRDIISGDEMFSDTFKFKVSSDGMFYEVEGKTITRTDAFDESLISANASAEEASEGTDSSSISGVDIVLNHKLQETVYSKKQYLSHMKDYVKAIKAKLEETNPERVDDFVKDATPAVKAIVAKLTSFQFFTGETMNPDGMVALLDYREESDTPYMLFFKDGLLAEKF